ncbi:hypothetical protein ALI22I_20145 [Saccharothrix sp. ALI-22-I]|uniref:hypothetical protein n=1 Tax=Saccharothrix sp. ALI-22-I TaxID=1933778 RepID=UPI00097CB9FC|nr:hypothetical protein [Saccharothrix sp. ALI-22-I]ONI88054.1 hypothetical protein ALI22I_20145 [Saccharothrix sp. ALI-22-I]
MPRLDRSRPRLRARVRRPALLVLLLGVLALVTGAPAAAAPVTGLDGLPAGLQKYVPDSDGWKSSPWMTAPDCGDKGGDFGLWAASIIVDTPELLEHFQAGAFGAEVEAQDKPRNDAILAGYRRLPGEIAASIPRDYCVDDVRRWAGTSPDTKPFGFPWGVTAGDGHQTSYYCTDRASDATRAGETNRFFGAERAPCDGFHIGCDNAQEVEKQRCQAWNTFSDDYVRRIEAFRAKALNDFPAQGDADTTTTLKSPGEIAQDVTDSWFGGLTETLVEGAATLLTESMTWYLRDDRSEMLSSPAIGEIHGMLRYVGIALLVGGVIWQGILLMYRRKADPLVTTGMGLLSFVAWSSLGGTVAILIHEGGVALVDQVLDDSIQDFSESTTATLLVLTPTAPGAVFGLALILLVLSFIQWGLGFLRLAGLLVLLALLPTAAAGQMTERTKPWLPKVLGVGLAIDLHQPVSGVIYAVGFKFMGTGGTLASALVGIAVIFLAVFSMSTLFKFFDWGGQQLVSGGGGGGGAAAMGAAASALGGGSGAGAFSRFMDRSGPAGNQDGNDSDAASVTPAHNGDGPSGGPTGDPSATTAQPPGNGTATQPAQGGDNSGVVPATGGTGIQGAAAGTTATAGAAAGPVVAATAAAEQGTQQIGGAMTGSDGAASNDGNTR